MVLTGFWGCLLSATEIHHQMIDEHNRMVEGGDKSGDTSEARAEQAAASLLVKLDIDEAGEADKKSSEKGKRKGKKKGKK